MSDCSSNDLIVQKLYDEIRYTLTASGRRMLKAILTYKGKHVTRNELAHLIGKLRLTRYDIELLKQLEAKGYIVSSRERLYDPREHMPPTWNYVYQINPRLRPYFKEITRRAQKRSPQSKGKPLFERLRDLIS